MNKYIEEIVQGFSASWNNPAWGRNHNPDIPAFYDSGAEEGDGQWWDESKIENWLRTTLLTYAEKEREEDKTTYRHIAELISSIFYHGSFKAETHNERELEKLLRDVNLWPTDENLIVKRMQYRESLIPEPPTSPKEKI